MANILIVEDEYTINELIKRSLQLVGHTCFCVYDGKAALEEMQTDRYDLILLDVMLPEQDGFSLFEKENRTPTIFLTAKDSLVDRIKGFSLGADDYITKPFEMLELTARVEAVLRRTRKDTRVFELENVRVEFDGRLVYRNQQMVDLTPKEYELLEVLITNRNIALSRDKLLELVWEYDFEGDCRTVDVHIQKLRKKLGWEACIKTVYKLGYRLEVLA
ncbi:response regulator transcription factor [Clostridium merdae]|uniref:response regulator transcription factor n=1 Tax=Clostridium merdae TaxID=1958780 RepID=UPI000A26DBE8|nr:response regulator transcription factor [Clostridium merdae]